MNPSCWSSGTAMLVEDPIVTVADQAAPLTNTRPSSASSTPSSVTFGNAQLVSVQPSAGVTRMSVVVSGVPVAESSVTTNPDCSPSVPKAAVTSGRGSRSTPAPWNVPAMASRPLASAMDWIPPPISQTPSSPPDAS